MTRAATASRRDRRPFASLCGRSEFSRLYREGHRSRVGPVVVLAAHGPSDAPQVGFVAGRRVGKAVERNRAKRRLREAMGRVVPGDGTTYVVIAQRGVTEATFSQLVDWLDEACREARRSLGAEEHDD